MSKLVRSMIVALWVVSPSAVLADIEANADSELDCQVTGYDLVIVNPGNNPVAAGTPLHWSVPFARMEGEHVLKDDLEPEGRVFLAGVLGSNHLDPKRPCSASIAQAQE